jgi:hypothetical protein
MTEGAFLYILRCADGSFYIGANGVGNENCTAQRRSIRWLHLDETASDTGLLAMV